MQKSVPLFLLGLFLINFASAQFFGGYGGGYGGYGFSLSDIFSRIDPQEMILVSLFVVLLLFISSGLKKIGLFRDRYGNPQAGVIVIISLVISLIATYGIYNSGYIYEIENFLNSSGLSPVWILLIILSIGIILKLGISAYLIIAGILAVLATILTDAFSEKTLPFIVGLAAFLIGLWIRKRLRHHQGASGYVHGGHRRRSWFSSI